jgi:UDP-glucose 4-epimerase
VSLLAGETILVTGASGFLGTHLCEHLKRQRCTLIGLDRVGPPSTTAFDRFVIGDLAAESEQCIQTFEPAVVFHLAGGSSVPNSVRDPFGDFERTVPGTASLLVAAAKASKPPSLVYFSSAAVYGEPRALPITEDSPIRPISPYGAHKAACEALLEHYARIHGLRVVILRIFSAYGEGLRRQFFWDLAGRALEAHALGHKQVSVLGAGDESRDFIHASDIASAARLAAECMGDGLEVYNVASGEETLISWAAERLLRALGLDLEFSFEGVAVPGNPTRWKGDISRLGALGFRPARSLEGRLPELATWIAAERAPRGE